MTRLLTFPAAANPCLAMAQKKKNPVLPGMVRQRLAIAMDRFNESTGTVASVGEMVRGCQEFRFQN
jgi:hypothetical protein